MMDTIEKFENLRGPFGDDCGGGLLLDDGGSLCIGGGIFVVSPAVLLLLPLLPLLPLFSFGPPPLSPLLVDDGSGLLGPCVTIYIGCCCCGGG